MRKLLILTIGCILLCGCRMDEAKLAETLYDTLKEQESMDTVPVSNMSKNYYSYYLPKSVGRLKSDELSTVLLKDNYKLIMNFDASQIVINEFYNKDISTNEPIDLKITKDAGDSLIFDGSFMNVYRVNHPYTLKVEKLENSKWMMKLEADYLLFTTIVPYAELPTMIEDCFTIARSLRYDSKMVLDNFSLKSANEAVKKKLEELNKELPTDGYLKDLETGN